MRPNSDLLVDNSRRTQPKTTAFKGHTDEKNLEIYRDLALADVSTEYQEAMRTFPIR